MIDAIPRYVFTIPRQTFPVPSPKINNFLRVHIANSHFPFLNRANGRSFVTLPKSCQNENPYILKPQLKGAVDPSTWFRAPACWHTIGARSTLHTLGLPATILSRPWRAFVAISKIHGTLQTNRKKKRKCTLIRHFIIFLQKNNPSDCVFFHKHFPRHSLRKPPTVQWYLCRKKRTFRDCKVGSLRQCLVPQWEILWGGILLSFPVLFFMSNWRKRETMRKQQQSQSKILEQRSHLLPPSRNQGNECIP